MQKDLLKELETLILKHGSSEGIACKKLPFLYLASMMETQRSTHHIAKPMVSLIVRGRKRILISHTQIEYRLGEYLVNSVDLPMSVDLGNISKESPFLGLGIILQSATIARVLADVDELIPMSSLGKGFGTGTAKPTLLDPIVRLVRLLDSPNDIPVLANGIEREIIWRLLNEQCGSIVKQLGLRGSRTNQISKAVHWIRRNFSEKLRVEKLAAFVGMSPTSFHRHFRLATSLSPIQFQKQVRLQEARIQLLGTHEDVTSVGLAVGYENASQFSREYKRMFGIQPSLESRLRQNIKTNSRSN